MKVRILIPNCDGHRLENSVPLDIPIVPPFGTRLRLTRETLLQMENIIYNHDDILLFERFLYGHDHDFKNMSNEEIRQVINKPDFNYKREFQKMDINFDDYDAVVDMYYNEADKTFYLVIGCAYTDLVLHETP